VLFSGDRIPSTRVVSLLASAVILICASLSAQAPSLPNLPDPQQVLRYLDQTIDWHRHLAVEEQLASDPSDVLFLVEDKQLAGQILRLSFDFARADAELLAATGQANTETNEAPESARYQSLSRAAATADAAVQQTRSELESYKQKLSVARGRARTDWQSKIDETQSELELAQTRSQTLHSILQFVGGQGKGNLLAQVDQLRHTVPELETTAGKPAGAQATAAAGSTSAAAATAVKRQRPSGIIGLASSLFALSSKKHALDQTLKVTDSLAKSGQNLRTPLISTVGAIARQGDQLAKQANTSDPKQLEQLKGQLDALTASFKQLSGVLMPLATQSLLFDAYKANVSRWRSAVDSEYRAEARSLAIRVAILAAVIAVILGLGELWRRATFRYIRDVRRRYQFLLLRRIVLWFAVGITVAFGLATEIGSIATFAGLITAGLAVALQNIVLAVVGYFLLIGKYGVKVGDRVQVAGVSGDVVDIGFIRTHLMELSGSGPGTALHPTGRVVAISNSTVFQAGAGFFRQIPGTNFVWHEVAMTVSPESDYRRAEQRMLEAVESIFAEYQGKIEQQYHEMERSLTQQMDAPRPQSRLRLTSSGLEIVVRYPLDLAEAATIDDHVTRKLLEVLEQEPELKVVGSGRPHIQPVNDRGTPVEPPARS
jgi:small-conductance mechanosensitive channel